jgi:hypothetical protein
MQYTKPNILTTVNATTNIMGSPKPGNNEDNGISHTVTAAYEADE